MRTTVDIPENLLRRARARAALEGTKMKDVVNEALRIHLGPDDREAESGRQLPDRVEIEQAGRFRLPVIRSPRPGQSAVTPERLKEAESEEDRERHGSVFGR